MLKIDIDRLLESTEELQADHNEFKVIRIEIDKFLECTREM